MLKSYNQQNDVTQPPTTKITRTDYDIIIIGGGITGLATAAALLHREQFPSSRLLILEQARKLHPIGATLGLFPNGLTALQSIGGMTLAQTVMDGGVAYRGVRSCQWNSEEQEWKTRDENRSGVGGGAGGGRYQQAHVLAWYLLQQALMETISDNSSYHPNNKDAFSNVVKFGMQFESFHQDPDTGILTLSVRDRNRNEKCDSVDSNADLWNVTCRVLIGADGIQSNVRDLVLQQQQQQQHQQGATKQESPYKFHNRVMYRAILGRDEFDSNIIFPPQGYTISYRCGRPGKVFAFRENSKHVYSFTSTVLVTNEFEATSPHLTSTKKSRLKHYFQDYPRPVQHVIESVRESAIYENLIHDLNLPTYWSKGSAVLIGDAAHAMTPALGQGGNIGLEDATELAHTLGRLFRRRGKIRNNFQKEKHPCFNQKEIEEALENFWRHRIERTTMVHALSRKCSEERNQGNPNPKIDRETIYNWKPSFM